MLDVYSRAPGGLLANGLAFAALFAAFPVALVTLGVAGWLVGDPAVQAQLAQGIGVLVPPLQDLVDQALLALSDGAAITSVVGLVGLIWTVSQFYVTLDVAFSRIFADRQERNVFRRAARGFVVGRRSRRDRRRADHRRVAGRGRRGVPAGLVDRR